MSDHTPGAWVWVLLAVAPALALVGLGVLLGWWLL